ncbi:type III polyketide synthase [Microbacterium sp. G2-8]|uniref:type III polyketide synthase n=1 Tax=Microbacterium sp. G2-8 TaxID=2842454 RepID=UPI001C89675D|nr:type III polyketide synthase [Microbacterium sp. G2-8]
MTAQLLSIGTAVPSAALSQRATRDFFREQPAVDRLTARLIGAAFDQSAIDTRYSVIGSIGEGGSRFTDDEQHLRTPSTGERNALYRAEAPPLSLAAARDALDRADRDPSDVTHVVTASCTGFFAPGPDYLLVTQLGIPTTAERYHIGFMGCAAGFPALRTAARICAAQPGAVVLVVCTELCSLHIRSSRDPEQIVASAVFGDGAGAAIVASDERPASGPFFDIGAFTTNITSEGAEDMDWTIGDHGFEMRLTAQVPRIIGREIDGVVTRMLGDGVDPLTSVDAWGVHPGGRSVLDQVQSGLGLPDAAMTPSRDVLREYGNMSSATILFILQRILADDSLPDGARVAGLCFGPGLTVETVALTRNAPAAA